MVRVINLNKYREKRALLQAIQEQGLGRILTDNSLLHPFLGEKWERRPALLKQELDNYIKKGFERDRFGAAEADESSPEEESICRLEKWSNVIPDSPQVLMMNKCVEDAVKIALSKQDNNMDNISRVNSYLISILNRNPSQQQQEQGVKIELSLEDCIILTNLINDLFSEATNEKLQQIINEKDMSDSFWSLMQDREHIKIKADSNNNLPVFSITSGRVSYPDFEAVKEIICKGLNPFNVSVMDKVIDKDAVDKVDKESKASSGSSLPSFETLPRKLSSWSLAYLSSNDSNSKE